MNQSNKAT